MPKELVTAVSKKDGREIVAVHDTDTGSLMPLPDLSYDVFADEVKNNPALAEQYLRPQNPLTDQPRSLPPLGINFPTDETGFSPTAQTMKLPTQLNYVRTPLRTFAETAPMTMGIAGAIAGGPAGMILGGPAGAFTQRMLQNEAPVTFGGERYFNPGDILQDMAIEGGLGAGFELGGAALRNMAPQQVKEWIAQKFFPIDKSKVATDFTTGPMGPNYPSEITVGQMNEKARRLQTGFARTAFVEALARQRQAAAGVFRPWMRNVQQMLGKGVQGAEGLSNQLGILRDADYGRWTPFLTDPANSRTVQIMQKNSKGQMVPIDDKIEGAVELTQSLPLARQALNDINKIIRPNPANPVNLGTGTGTELAKIAGELGKIAKTKTPVNGAPVMSFAKLEQIYNDLGKLVDELPESNIHRQSLKAVRDTIDNDLIQGVRSWGPQAEAAYKNYRNSAQRLAQQIDPKRAQALLQAGKNGTETLQDITQDALKDAQKMGELVQRTKDTQKDLGSKIIKNDVANAGYISKDSTFDAGLSLDRFMQLKHSGVLEKAMSPSEIMNIESFLRFAQHTPGGLEQGVENALMLTWGRSGATLGTAALGTLGLLEGREKKEGISGYLNPKTVFAGLISLGIPTMNQLVKRILMDPKVADVVRGAVSPTTAGPVREKLSRELAKLIQGGRVFTMTYKGMPIEGEIDKNGDVIFPRPPSPSLPRSRKINILEPNQQY